MFLGLDDEGKDGNISYGLGHRHIQAFLLFVCLTLSFITSGHTGVTVVAMSINDNSTDEATNFMRAWNFGKRDTSEIVKYVDVYQVSINLKSIPI